MLEHVFYFYTGLEGKLKQILFGLRVLGVRVSWSGGSAHHGITSRPFKLSAAYRRQCHFITTFLTRLFSLTAYSPEAGRLVRAETHSFESPVRQRMKCFVGQTFVVRLFHIVACQCFFLCNTDQACGSVRQQVLYTDCFTVAPLMVMMMMMMI
ncbi:hypothetical protein E2C01_014175 [Portunus trituberculatus]|uniref:Uncharacterized protein n=1 Tax=Portunus trituberculatus TaxID=210409 RepID=A0A5B7DIH0_PORTR|nr:hypothetical protein [Portunus trituberculatus]